MDENSQDTVLGGRFGQQRTTQEILGHNSQMSYDTYSMFSNGYNVNITNDYILLKHVLMNEKASPEILPFETDLLSRLRMRMEQQESLLEQHEFDLSEQHSDILVETQEIIRAMLAVELTRVKYMMRSYLRVRLFKIEAYVMHCIESTEVQQRLSEQERAYALDFLRLVGSHLKIHVTSKFPEAFGSVTKQASAHSGNDMIPVPDIGHHVFVRVQRDLGEVVMYEDGTTQELMQGDLYILRYKVIREYLDDGGVQLV